MTDVQSSWSEQYSALVQRNVGFITAEQQERLRNARVAVLGVGGVGGSAFEVLVRSGIERFSIVDCDRFDATNMNRQVFATQDTLGELKVDVAARWALSVNQEVRVQTFERVGEDNIGDILDDADVVVMGIDSLLPCLIASRKAREMRIPAVEGWAIPFGNVRVFTGETPTLEEAYDLPTVGKPLSDLSDRDVAELQLKVLMSLGQIEGVADYYTEETLEKIRQGHIVSFAPTVRLTAILLALEAIKVLLDWGKLSLSPHFAVYDPFMQRIPSKTPQR